jgi:phage antirepressor YoqD-like protein
MNELATEKTMTVQKIAESLNIPERTIQANIVSLYPELVKNGIKTRLNEEQVTRVKQKMYSSHNLAGTREVAYTELEREELIALAMKLQNKKVLSLQVELKEAEEMRDRLIHTGKLYTASEIATEMGYKSAIKFNKILKDLGIQYKVNGTWVMTAAYSDKGYTSTKELELDTGQIIYDRKWTGLGRDFLLNIKRLNMGGIAYGQNVRKQPTSA